MPAVRQGQREGRPRGGLVDAEDVTPDHRDNPVGDDREEHGRGGVRDHGPGAGRVARRVVHRGRQQRAHHDQRALDTAGLALLGQAEAEHREDDHADIEHRAWMMLATF